MKKLKPILLAAAALGGLALMAAAALLDLPGGITGLMCGMGGALLGLGGSSVIMGAVERHMSPRSGRSSSAAGPTSATSPSGRRPLSPAGTGPCTCCGSPL